MRDVDKYYIPIAFRTQINGGSNEYALQIAANINNGYLSPVEQDCSDGNVKSHLESLSWVSVNIFN